MFRVIVDDPQATLPRRGTPESAGLDLFALEPQVLVPGVNKVRTGIKVAEFPPDHFGLIKSRSSMSKLGIEVGAGVIDNDYRGEIIVMLNSTTTYTIDPRRSIAQLIVMPYSDCTCVSVGEAIATARGEGGFGSTN